MKIFLACFPLFTAVVSGFQLTSPFAPRTFGRSEALGMARQQRQNPRNRPPPIEKPTMNEEITAPELRVVTPTPGGKDEALGILTRQEALEKAAELGGLDLILINDKSDPPVCKIVDYSKYRYMQEKKAKEVKKNSKATEIKEVKMSYKIDIHDYEVRRKNAAKFIKQGNRVKATVMFRGREMQHDRLGYDLLDKLAVDLEEVCVREGKAKREGRNLSLILGPRAEVLKAVNEGRKSQEKMKKKKKQEAFQERKNAKKPSLDGDDDDSEESENSTNTETESTGLPIGLGFDDDISEDSIDKLLGSEELVDELFSKN